MFLFWYLVQWRSIATLYNMNVYLISRVFSATCICFPYLKFVFCYLVVLWFWTQSMTRRSTFIRNRSTAKNESFHRGGSSFIWRWRLQGFAFCTHNIMILVAVDRLQCLTNEISISLSDAILIWNWFGTDLELCTKI